MYRAVSAPASVLLIVLGVVALLAALAAPLGNRVAAQGVTPDAGTPEVGTPVAMAADAATPVTFAEAPPEVCTEEEIDNGFAEITAVPSDQAGGITDVFAMSESYLYLVTMTVPAGVCFSYYSVQGAAVLLVEAGTVEYTAQLSERGPSADEAVVEWGGEGWEAAVVPFGAPLALGPGDWVTQDREVWFTIRNSGKGDAVVAMSVFTFIPAQANGCSGGCRGRP